jgi:hypothetical protein
MSFFRYFNQMETLLTIQGLSPSGQEELFAALQRVETCEESGNAVEASKAKEELADLLKQFGLHEESRQYYHDLENHSIFQTDKSRLLRKIALAYITQRQIIKGQRFAEEALGLLRKVDQRHIDMQEFFETLITCSFANYFINNRSRHEELIREIKTYFPVVTDQSVKLRFYYAILHDMLLRYRWYMLPEESITHAEYYLHLAHETGNLGTIVDAYSIFGFIHLWREEFEPCRKNFDAAFSLLQEGNPDLILMNQIYTTVSYRMQNNLAMTERWAHASMELAKKTKNEIYIAMSYGNLAWVYAKRNNWLYAENAARNSFAILTFFRYAVIPMCIFPLLECLYRKGKYEEAGTYSYFLLHPSLKRLPDTINRKIEQLNFAWSLNNKEVRICLEDLITEAKLTNYF